MANHLVPIILVSRWELCNWVIAFSDGGHFLYYRGVSIWNYSGLYYPPFFKKNYICIILDFYYFTASFIYISRSLKCGLVSLAVLAFCFIVSIFFHVVWDILQNLLHVGRSL